MGISRLAVIVEFEVEPSRLMEFLGRLREDAVRTLREAGCLRMEVLLPHGEPERVLLSELWRDQAALDAHRSAPDHSHAWQEALIRRKRATICDSD